jgi:hypothetical protein
MPTDSIPDEGWVEWVAAANTDTSVKVCSFFQSFFSFLLHMFSAFGGDCDLNFGVAGGLLVKRAAPSFLSFFFFCYIPVNMLFVLIRRGFFLQAF